LLSFDHGEAARASIAARDEILRRNQYESEVSLSTGNPERTSACRSLQELISLAPDTRGFQRAWRRVQVEQVIKTRVAQTAQVFVDLAAEACWELLTLKAKAPGKGRDGDANLRPARDLMAALFQKSASGLVSDLRIAHERHPLQVLAVAIRTASDT